MGNYLPISAPVTSPGEPSWPFVGHVAQIKAVRQLVAQAKPSAGAVALVCAGPGFGKSRFLREVAARESGSSAVMSLECAVSVARRRSLREQLAAALGERDLRGFARGRSVLCTLDDLHEAALADRSAVEELVRAASSSGAVILAACASSWLGASDLARAGAVCVELAALDAARSEIWLKAMLSAYGQTAAAEDCAAMLRIAAGNPRYLQELVNRLPEVRSGRAPLLPHSAQARVARLRAELGPAAFRILRDAAVFGSEFVDEWLVRLVGRPRSGVIAALQAGVDAELLRELSPLGASSFVFRDEAVRSALYETLVTSQRKIVHVRIAANFAAHAPGDEFESLVARHWAEAGEADRAVSALQHAAARAARQLNFTEAQQLTNRAAALAQRDSEAWWATQERLADYAASAGEFRGASKIRRRLAEHYRALGRNDEALEQLTRLMHDYWYDGRFNVASATHRRLQNLGKALRGDQRATFELGWAELCEAAGRRTEAMRILHSLPAEALRRPAIALQHARQVASVGGRDRSIAQTLAMFEGLAGNARERGERSEEYYTATAAATTAAELGLVETGLDWLRRARNILTEHADAAVGTARFLPLQLCELLLLQGRFEEARDAIAESGLGKRFGEYWEALLSGFCVFIGLRLGDASLIAPYFNRMHLHRAMRAGQAEAAGVMLWGYSEMMQSHGMHDELSGVLHRCVESGLIDPYFSIQLHCARFGAEEDVCLARRQLDLEVARESNAVARAAAKLFDGFAAARQNRVRPARSAARTAAAAYRVLQWPWMEALALETAGDRAEAAALYASCGAVRDADRAAGQSRKERRAAFGASLTPRESEIRGLVVLGLKNREIASRLRLSERTVGHHLESIFSKCGVRARWQLAQEALTAGVT
jgi:DNA-binding CsgD family transcriptional regulator